MNCETGGTPITRGITIIPYLFGQILIDVIGTIQYNVQTFIDLKWQLALAIIMDVNYYKPSFWDSFMTTTYSLNSTKKIENPQQLLGQQSFEGLPKKR